MRKSFRNPKLRILREMLPHTAIVVIVATVVGLAAAAYQSRHLLAIDAEEIADSLFRAVLTAAISLLVWTRQESVKLQETWERARLLLRHIEQTLGSALHSELTAYEEARWRQGIQKTRVLKDADDLRESVLKLVSLKLLPEGAGEKAARLQNDLHDDCCRATCKTLLTELHGYFSAPPSWSR